MPKQKKEDMRKEKPEKKPENRIYKGAKWIGARLSSPTLGILEPGTTYQIPEDQAKNTSGFEPIYETE